MASLAHNDADDRLREAKIRLHEFHFSGPHRSDEVKHAAAQAGMTWRSLWAAKKELSVKAVRLRSANGNHYEWRLYQDDVLSHEEQAMLMTPTPGNVTSDWSLEMARQLVRGFHNGEPRT